MHGGASQAMRRKESGHYANFGCVGTSPTHAEALSRHWEFARGAVQWGRFSGKEGGIPGAPCERPNWLRPERLSTSGCDGCRSTQGVQ